MASAAQFAAVVGTKMVQIATANTARDGTGTMGTVLTAGASGTMIFEVTVNATSAVTIGTIRLFLHDGTTARILDEIPVQTASAGSGLPPWRATRTYRNLLLPSGWSLRAATEKAETFNVFAFAGDF